MLLWCICWFSGLWCSQCGVCQVEVKFSSIGMLLLIIMLVLCRLLWVMLVVCKWLSVCCSCLNILLFIVCVVLSVWLGMNFMFSVRLFRVLSSVGVCFQLLRCCSMCVLWCIISCVISEMGVSWQWEQFLMIVLCLFRQVWQIFGVRKCLLCLSSSGEVVLLLQEEDGRVGRCMLGFWMIWWVV